MPTDRPSPDGPRCTWVLALAALLMLLVLGTARATAPSPWTAPTALSKPGAGPASTAEHDPIRQLVIDITEHLPAATGGATLPPLPLHTPWLPLGDLLLDEMQGVEWAGHSPPGSAVAHAAQRRPTPPGLRFASIDPRRNERPPTDPDRPRP